MHLVAGVGDFLQTCSAGGTSVTPSGLTPLQLLLLHDEVTDALRQSSTMEATARHIVASTFIGCLSGVDLALTVESFFVDWESRQSIAAAARQSVRTEPVGVDATAGLSADNSVDDEQWMDCIITHEDLRPEAFEQHTLAEQHRILREMFAEDWSEEDELALETVSVAHV